MFKVFVSISLAFLLIACNGAEDEDEVPSSKVGIDHNSGDIQRIFLVSSKVNCYGVGHQLCNWLRVDSSADFTLNYDGIEGFDFSWGHNYELEVDVIQVENAPADGSSFYRRLIRIISDIEDPIGAEYSIDHVDFTGEVISFNKNSNEYTFLEDPFTCSSDVDCETLLLLNNSGGQVNLTFSYTGDGSIQLIDWN